MKRIGIIGGLGPEATIAYYRSIIDGVQQSLGSRQVLPEISIVSVDMYRMFSMLDTEDYESVETYLANAADELQASGAGFGLMCGNTPHIVFDGIQRRTKLPLLSMVSTALHEAQHQGLHRLGLLGTKFTMQHDFFTTPFAQAGIEMHVPNPNDQEIIHQKIVNELENGIVRAETKATLLEIISRMIDAYALDGIVFGCTELPLILKPEDLSVSTLDIAAIHIQAAVDVILGDAQ